MKSTSFTAPDGTAWTVLVQMPASSNAMIYFRHPDGESSRLDRYNWVITNGAESRSVTGRLDPETVLDSLKPAEIARLFGRSIPVSRRDSLQKGPEPTRGA